MTVNDRKFKLVGIGGEARNGFFSTIVTDVTELYGSKLPLVASRKLGYNEDWQETAAVNKDKFLNPRTWRVSQYKGLRRDIVGIKMFKMVRMDIFNTLWRKPIVISEYNMKYQRHSHLFELHGKSNEWGDDTGFQLHMDYPRDTFSWLYKYKPLVYIFSDEDRMFLDAADELAFIADVHNSEE